MEANYRSHCCAELLPGLLCGSLTALRHIQTLKITHVLSVYNVDVHPMVGDADHMQIAVQDVEDTILLEVLKQAHEYINEALSTEDGRVLIHCYAGMSRSVTITLSYIMKTKDMTLMQALNLVSNKYPYASPNEGFVEQLEFFQKAGFDFRDLAKKYREWKKLPLPATDDLPYKITRHYGGKEERDADYEFECRKCHMALGDSDSVHNSMKIDLLSETGTMYVEQLDWMKDQSGNGNNAGKLYCPHCSAKLGSFDWSGLCDGQVWHVPGFQLHLGKLDFRQSSDKISQIIRHPKAFSEENQEVVMEYVVFDCDGVLVNTEVSSCESLYRCIRDVTGFEIPRKFPEDYYEVFGMDVRSCLEFYNSKFSLGWIDLDELATKAIESKEEHYRELTDRSGVPAFDGVSLFIEKLKQRGVPYGVASSGQPEKIQRNLTRSALLPLFDRDKVVSAAEVRRGKPAPDVYLEAFKRIGCKCPEKCLVIEDSINGLKAAKTAGAYAVGITNSLPRSHLKPFADLVVDHISELDKILPSLKGRIELTV